MKLIFSLLIILAAFNLYAAEPGRSEPAGSVERPYTAHITYFEGTDYELNVYEIFGRQDGNTIFMLGGIQGDEPGGYLATDLYSNLRLERGNLIVIPRANLKSVILSNRGTDGDMNRLFVEDLNSTGGDYEVVKVIMEYMSKADMFLNLHDGWGYYSPVHINDQRNPKRFGQSIIVDEAVYSCGNGERTLLLEEMVQDVLLAVNAKITDKNHHLSYFNTHTGRPDSQYKSMQKTATWYALQNYCIPAFGIESSKNIKSLELKVLYHNYAVNEFMRIMDIVPENPPIITAPAVLNQALITVNGESQYVASGDVIEISKYDKVAVNNVEANFTRGISCDVLGYGNLNDLKKEFAIAYSTKVIFRKEDRQFAEISIKVKVETSTSVVTTPTGYQLELEYLGETKYLAANASLDVKSGESFKLKRLLYNGKDTDLPLNLRGWVPENVSQNSGDDRGYDITVTQQSMIKRFSTGGRGVSYPITIDQAGKEIMRVYIKISN